MALNRTGVSASTAPTGIIMAYPGTVAPTEWLLCNGGEYPQSSYSSLASLLGYTDTWSNYVASLSPEGFWRMNDSSGNFADSSGNARTLTQAGTAPTYQQTGAIVDDSDKSVLFNGSAYGSRAIWNTSRTNITLAAWVNLADAARHGTAIYNGTASGGGPPYNGYGIGVGDTNTETNGNNVIVHYHGIINFSGGPIGTGWHLIAMSLDGSSALTLYVDGRQVYTQSATLPTVPASSFWVGSTATYGSTEANYGIDEALFFNAALTATQHKLLYLNGLRRFIVPDLRGRVAVGLDNIGGSDAGVLSVSNTLGLTGGTQTHTLATAEMASHTHGITDGTHYHNVYTGGDAYSLQVHSAGAFTDNFGGTAYPNAAGISIQNAGSGSAHNNMQPYVLTNYIVKT